MQPLSLSLALSTCCVLPRSVTASFWRSSILFLSHASISCRSKSKQQRRVCALIRAGIRLVLLATILMKDTSVSFASHLFLFPPTTIPQIKFEASVWLGKILPATPARGFGQLQRSCSCDRQRANKVVEIWILSMNATLSKNSLTCKRTWF